MPAERTRNPFTASSRGGRTLSALQLPFFLVRPPAGYAVLTAPGRRTGRTRRRCVRAIRRDDEVYVVAIKGVARSGWAKNALAADSVELRLPGGRRTGRARRPSPGPEFARARDAYCGTIRSFDYLTWLNWRKGRPSRAGIEELLRDWFERGTPLVIELDARP